MFVFSHVTSKKGKKDAEDSDSDMDDLDDEEVSLGSMDEEDFGDELEEEGGTFMDPDEGGEDDDESREYRKACAVFGHPHFSQGAAAQIIGCSRCDHVLPVQEDQDVQPAFHNVFF